MINDSHLFPEATFFYHNVNISPPKCNCQGKNKVVDDR